MNYLLHLAILIEIYLILSLSLNLLIGYTGLLSLSHAAFYGIGAYATALLMTQGFPFLSAAAAAICIAILVSLLVSYASVRFHGDYFILATLALQTIVFAILYNWVQVTRGPYGITGIPVPEIAGFSIKSLPAFALFGLILAMMTAFMLSFIKRSAFGRVLQAIRDDEVAAAALGKETVWFKIRSVAISSGCAALAGALYATYVTFIDPTSFTTDESILIACMVVIGGTGNTRGPVIGAILLVLLPEILKLLAIPSSYAPNVRLLIYGFLLILMMRFRPAGIAGRYQME